MCLLFELRKMEHVKPLFKDKSLLGGPFNPRICTYGHPTLASIDQRHGWPGSPEGAARPACRLQRQARAADADRTAGPILCRQHIKHNLGSGHQIARRCDWKEHLLPAESYLIASCVLPTATTPHSPLPPEIRDDLQYKQLHLRKQALNQY